MLPVVWNPIDSGPSANTDHALKPRDRVYVALPEASEKNSPAQSVLQVAPPLSAPILPSSAEASDFNASPVTSAPAPSNRRADDDAAAKSKITQVMFSIDLVQDDKGSFAEFEALRDGRVSMTADSATILPALRILAKHRLIRTISSPRIVCTTGQKAQLEVGGRSNSKEEPWQGLKLEAICHEDEAGLAMEVKLESTHSQHKFGVDTAMVVADGETIIIRADKGDASNDPIDDLKPDR